MMLHTLKTSMPYFEAVKSGDKNFEVRRDDRGFQKGDILELICIDAAGMVVGNMPPICRRVKWILTGGQFGIEAGYVVLALEPFE